MTVSRIKANTLIFAALLAESQICGIINTFITIPNISVLLIVALVLCSVLCNGFPRRFYSKSLILAAVISILLFLSLILNGTRFTYNYILHFIVFGMGALYISSYEIDFWRMFRYVKNIFFAYMAVYVFFGRQPFLQSEEYWNIQMGMAYTFCTIAIIMIIDVYHSRFLFGRLVSTLLAAMSIWFMLFDCGTRGAVLSFAFFCFCFILFNIRNDKAIILLIATSLIGIVCIMNLDSILLHAETFLGNAGFHIPALEKTLNLAAGEGGMDNGRMPLYQNAIECIKKSPLFGGGVGFYEKNMYLSSGKSPYVHQFALEVLCEFGIVGLLVVIFLLRKGLMVPFNTDRGLPEGDRILGLVLLSISMPMLTFTNAYWLAPNFWLFLSWCIYYNRRKRKFCCQLEGKHNEGNLFVQ